MNEQRPQVIEVRVKQDHSLIWFLLFGWWYLGYRLAKWGIVTTWKLCVAYPWKWTIALSRATVRGARWFHAKYGWRGWAILSAVVVVLAILGNLTSH